MSKKLHSVVRVKGTQYFTQYVTVTFPIDGHIYSFILVSLRWRCMQHEDFRLMSLDLANFALYVY